MPGTARGAGGTDADIAGAPDTAGADGSACGRVGRCHPADAEAVAPVDVGHSQRGPDDTGQTGDVSHLLGRFVLLDPFNQNVVRVDNPVNVHAGFV